jgi:MtN3 and saliva related transmembrane protein
MTFATLATGVALWVVYGVLQSDAVIILANAVSLALLIGILYFKWLEWRATRHAGSARPPRRVL